MELLLVLNDHGVLVCQKCGHIINPCKLAEHFRAKHATHLQQARLSAVALATECTRQLRLDDLPPYARTIAVPPPESPPLPGLVVQQGYGCSLCPRVRRDEMGMSHHFTQKHPYQRKRGEKPWKPISFQQFTRAGANKTMFRVRQPSLAEQELERRRDDIAAQRIRSRYQDQLLARLEREESALAAQSVQRLGAVQQTEVSPWLEATRWHQYLHDHPLHELAALAELHDPQREPVLRVVCDSLQRVVDNAYRSICDDRINVFDQLRINTFQSNGRLFSRPLAVKLQKGTWRTYINLWKRLLCFLVRSTHPDQPIILTHILTRDQRECLRTLLDRAGKSLYTTSLHTDMEAAIDRAYLLLCISLLDHKLRGGLHESVALGFLAVLGIDTTNNTLREAHTYTPMLSQFIKIAQLLMVQRAVTEVDEQRAEYPSDILEEMCSKFMLDNTSSPLAWAIRLRAFGKKIKTSTTSQGFISWSEDQETLAYRDIELTMGHFRKFVAEQMRQVQALLRHILLLHEEEQVIDVVPRLPLADVKDNPANTAHSWCFLDDPRNQHVFAPGDKWLMKRVLGQDWLQTEFVRLDENSRIEWKSDSLRAYNTEVAQFLKLLLLLVHLTAGQPARGTELMSLRYRNASHHRNVFIEHGLVSTVTSYHKGYSVQGSTKIIHRYLPRPVSELLIYYLWLVVPFQRQLRILTDISPESAYQPWLWTSSPHDVPWTSPTLSAILQRQSRQHFQKGLNLQTYRQIAIAISRTHLASGGFKIDYGIEQKAADAQAAHESNLAGSIYARGLQQAHGQMEARQAIFRAVSREWHEFLGFCRPLGPRKRGFGQLEPAVAVLPLAKKRKATWETLDPAPDHVGTAGANLWLASSTCGNENDVSSPGPVFGVLKPTLKWVR